MEAEINNSGITILSGRLTRALGRGGMIAGMTPAAERID
jgi:hypothetical protein